jgi:hypothetical protein
MNNPTPRRTFTAVQDDAIRLQPVNGMSIWQLARILRTSRQAVERRAYELGVELVKHHAVVHHRGPSSRRKAATEEHVFYTEPAWTVDKLGDDPLLAALKEGKR